MSSKNLVTETYHEYSIDEDTFDGEISVVVGRLHEIDTRCRLDTGAKSVQINVKSGYYDEWSEYSITYLREETEDERKKRLAENRKKRSRTKALKESREARKEAEERATYEKLKAKFEDKNV